ncbi:hypothetical protein BT67DRAFT_286912 [Trichocladium antarcticum]|uniref:Uncharacterized protein n=1 Tax=Trichocladium antarcticum TaxID=1450529 RepID=A0AAN6UKX7_9PEZI|nr:hypothetical protein BT67DRAFT_286912 [Trichocladium antarcticum]
MLCRHVSALKTPRWSCQRSEKCKYRASYRLEAVKVRASSQPAVRKRFLPVTVKLRLLAKVCWFAFFLCSWPAGRGGVHCRRRRCRSRHIAADTTTFIVAAAALFPPQNERMALGKRRQLEQLDVGIPVLCALEASRPKTQTDLFLRAAVLQSQEPYLSNPYDQPQQRVRVLRVETRSSHLPGNLLHPRSDLDSRPATALNPLETPFASPELRLSPVPDQIQNLTSELPPARSSNQRSPINNKSLTVCQSCRVSSFNAQFCSRY